MTHCRNFWLLLFASAALLTPSFVISGFAQGSGRLQGTVRVASGAPIAGVSVIATNQVTGKWKRVRSGVDGRYSLSLSSGAYRVRVAAPHIAKFDKDKNYGDFTTARGEALENVIVEAGKETVVDIPLDQVETKEIARGPGDRPTGHAGAATARSDREVDGLPDRDRAREQPEQLVLHRHARLADHRGEVDHPHTLEWARRDGSVRTAEQSGSTRSPRSLAHWFSRIRSLWRSSSARPRHTV